MDPIKHCFFKPHLSNNIEENLIDLNIFLSQKLNDC
jgi:hypothetical protein